MVLLPRRRGMNEGQLVLDNAVYEFEDSGALKTAKWLENTGGGAYNAGCYDDVAQDLFGQLGDEKKEQYFDAYPDREREYDGDNHTSYDRYAGFIMDMKLNKIAQSRLAGSYGKRICRRTGYRRRNHRGHTGIDPLSQKCFLPGGICAGLRGYG